MASEENKNDVPTTVALTEEQIEFLASCERCFTGRYTEDDADFMDVKDNTPKGPPIVDPWYSRPRRNDWADRRGPRGGNNDNDRRYQHRGYQHRHQNEGGYQHHRQGDRYYQRSSNLAFQRPY